MTRLNIAMIVGLALVAAVAGAFFYGREAGKGARDLDAAKGRLESIEDDKERRNEIENLDGDSLRERLGRWIVRD